MRRLLLVTLMAAMPVVAGIAATSWHAGAYEFIGARWPAVAMPIPYCVNASGIPIGAGNKLVMTPEEFAQQVQRAFGEWQRATDSAISFRNMGFCDSDAWDRGDGVNTVGWDGLGGGVVGLEHSLESEGISVREGKLGEIYEADIVIDTFLAQSYDDISEYLRDVLPHILLHETGHFIGLGHSRHPCATMAPYGLRSGLCQDDMDGARTLYPSNGRR
jgi:hypothetical protein